MNIYVGDLHIHTNHSDGADSAEQVVLSARNAGLDFIAITDHNKFDGYIEAKSVVEKYVLGLIVIPGEEITADWGHLLALNIKENISPEGSPEEICRMIHSQKGLVFAAHPYWANTREKFWNSGLFDSLLENDSINGFELINSENVSVQENIVVINKYRELCSKKNYPAIIGGSDAHTHTQIGKNIRLYVIAKTLSQENICEAIRDGMIVVEWQRKFYGNNDIISDIDLWYSDNFIEHLRACQQEVAPFV